MLFLCIALGVLFCVFWIAQLVFVSLHLKWTNSLLNSGNKDEAVGVSVIHPIKDLDFELEKNIYSWLDQNYKGPVEHIFSFQDPDDAAIPVVKKVISDFPKLDCNIIVNPLLQGLNGKSSNMVNGVRISKYDILIFGDSDTRVKRDFLVKMVRPLKNEKVGIMTCGQINMGGKDFWTRFFTFIQNCETDFNWGFLTKLGIDVGATGAAFGMRKSLLKQIGGLEAFGGSLLEDMHLGSALYRMGYKIVLGPFVECHVNKLKREKSFNYAKRIAIGVRTHIAFELPGIVILLFWYWVLFILSLITGNTAALSVCFVFIGIRAVHGLFQRIITRNRILPVDIIMAPFFDLFGTFYLVYATFTKPYVTWRGIKYEVRKGGFIEDMYIEIKK